MQDHNDRAEKASSVFVYIVSIAAFLCVIAVVYILLQLPTAPSSNDSDIASAKPTADLMTEPEPRPVNLAFSHSASPSEVAERLGAKFVSDKNAAEVFKHIIPSSDPIIAANALGIYSFETLRDVNEFEFNRISDEVASLLTHANTRYYRIAFMHLAAIGEYDFRNGIFEFVLLPSTNFSSPDNRVQWSVRTGYEKKISNNHADLFQYDPMRVSRRPAGPHFTTSPELHRYGQKCYHLRINESDAEELISSLDGDRIIQLLFIGTFAYPNSVSVNRIHKQYKGAYGLPSSSIFRESERARLNYWLNALPSIEGNDNTPDEHKSKSDQTMPDVLDQTASNPRSLDSTLPVLGIDLRLDIDSLVVFQSDMRVISWFSIE
jgi:hypothetical protein